MRIMSDAYVDLREGLNHDDDVLTLIAMEVGKKNKHGAFITAMALAWSIADPGNKNLIRTVWSDVIDKYALRDVFSKQIKEHLPEY